jgi:WD40 repeat protein
LFVALAAAGAALAVTAAGLGAAGSGVVDRVRDTLGIRHAATMLVRLPTAGRLLVNTPDGPWIVSADGSKRHLGGTGYAQASWSPHGLYEVVVLHRRELAAIDPKGSVRWSLARGLVADPRWSGDGYRIAYRSHSSLRVVAGDGTGDHLLARSVAPIAPAWNGSTHQLAYADRQGRIHLADADSGSTIWTAKPEPVPTAIAWEPGGRLLLALDARSIRILRADDGLLVKRIPLAPGRHLLAVSPHGPVAVTTRSSAGQTTIVLLHPQHPSLKPRPIFSGAGAFNGIAWSPDGAWLLASWSSADQWVFVKLEAGTGAVKHVSAVSAIARAFDTSRQPTLGGWCCSAGVPSP